MSALAVPAFAPSVAGMSFDPIVYRALRISAPEAIHDAALLLRDTVRVGAGLDITTSGSIACSRPMRDARGEVLAARIFTVALKQRWWLDRTLALRSPLIAATRLSGEPFWCNAHGIYARDRRRILPDINLSGFAQRALTRCAIVVPVHLPRGQIGVASMVSPDPDCEDLGDRFEACIDVLALYAARFVSSYARTMEAVPRTARTRVLSSREAECLRWASLGKTNEETGVIVGLSQATVRFHIRNAMGKLDAVNRDQAVFKASQLGYLPASR